MPVAEYPALTAVAMQAEGGCSRCPRRILLLEKAFLDESYAAVCVECAARMWREFLDEFAPQRVSDRAVYLHATSPGEARAVEAGYRQAVEDCIAGLREAKLKDWLGPVVVDKAADFLRDRFLSGSSPEEAEERCPTCGLVNPGPEHRANEPMLCSESRSPVSEEAVERAAEAIYDAQHHGQPPWADSLVKETWRDVARAALRAASSTGEDTR